MCGLFGFVNYSDKEMKGADRLASLLSKAAAVRGTHATGVSYVMDEIVNIDKAPESAYKFNISMPTDTVVLMGHTRYTTQGNEKHNFNNHPFRGTTKKYGSFALAHNGIIQNDYALQKSYDLPRTKIETDSYVAVQMIEKFCKEGGEFGMDAMKYMAEKVYGMFTFTILDETNRLFIVKGDSPLSILHFKNIGLYVYASTRQILMEAIMGSSIGDTIMEKFLPGNGRDDIELLEPDEGDIWCINPDGSLITAEFKPIPDYSYSVVYSGHTSRYLVDSWDDYYTKGSTTTMTLNTVSPSDDDYSTYRSVLYQIASSEGFAKHEVDLVLEFGYDTVEVEDAIYDKTFGMLLDEVKSYFSKLAQQKDKQSEDESHVTKLASEEVKQ